MFIVIIIIAIYLCNYHIGLVAFDEDFEAELAENHDARAEVSLLSRSLDPELTDVSY